MSISNITLTSTQESVFKQVKEFLKSDAPVFILKGYAGTGKTTMVRHIVNYISQSLNKEPCLMAPTGRAAKRMSEANNRILFIRGNHDNPAYFDGRTFAHKRFLAIPDYSVVKANGHTILCIGGAVSVDRSYRLEAWEQNQKKLQKFGYKSNDTDLLTPNYYWSDEAPKFDKEILTQILVENTLDTVITHTAPSFCELQSKSGLGSWAVRDASLLYDVQQERSSMDAIFNALKGQSITHWCYGHFHQSWHSPIEGTLFKMLDIMELYEIR